MKNNKINKIKFFFTTWKFAVFYLTESVIIINDQLDVDRAIVMSFF